MKRHETLLQSQHDFVKDATTMIRFGVTRHIHVTVVTRSVI